MTLVIISGGIDLSVGPTAAMSAVIAATMLVAGVPVPLAILAASRSALLCGLRQRRARRLWRAAALHRHTRHAQHLPRPGADLHRRQSGLRLPAGVPRHLQSARSSACRCRSSSSPSSPCRLGHPQEDAARRISARRRRQRGGGLYRRRAGRDDQDRRLRDLRRPGRTCLA